MSKVLIADDDFISLEVLKAMLSAYPVSILTASNGAEAVKVAREELPQLIFLDYEMPEMTGAEACQEIKQNPKLTTIPIIALTGHQTEAELRACKEAGMIETLFKPISPEALAQIIQTYL